MADDPGDGEAEDERALELSTVAAIYPELETDAAPDHISATLSIAVEPIKPVLISFPPADGTPPGGLPTPPNSTDEDTNQVEEHKQGSIIAQDAHNLSYLPPLSLRIVLPEGYPTEKPPLVQLESQFSWLPKKRLLELEAAGNTVWEEVGRDQMVFSYIDHLREAAENAFGLAKEEGEVLAVPSDLKVALLDFDLKAQRAKFEQETFDCGICLGTFICNLQQGSLTDNIQSRKRAQCVIASSSAPMYFASHACKSSTIPASQMERLAMSSVWHQLVDQTSRTRR